MNYNAAERADVKAAEKAAKLFDQQKRDMTNSIMSTTPGRAWMLDRLERCHVFSISYTNNANATAFAEGERNIGLQDLNDIMATCPDMYVLMLQERNARDASRRIATEQRSSSEDSGGSVEGSEPESSSPAAG